VTSIEGDVTGPQRRGFTVLQKLQLAVMTNYRRTWCQKGIGRLRTQNCSSTVTFKMEKD